jgi:hypothetical protein
LTFDPNAFFDPSAFDANTFDYSQMDFSLTSNPPLPFFGLQPHHFNDDDTLNGSFAHVTNNLRLNTSNPEDNIGMGAGLAGSGVFGTSAFNFDGGAFTTGVASANAEAPNGGISRMPQLSLPPAAAVLNSGGFNGTPRLPLAPAAAIVNSAPASMAASMSVFSVHTDKGTMASKTASKKRKVGAPANGASAPKKPWKAV